MFDAFLSYSRKDEAFAQKLRDALIEAGKTVWLDTASIRPSEDWHIPAYIGVDSSHNFLFIISPDSVVSAPCSQEIARSIASGKRIITLRYKTPPPETVPPSISSITYIKFADTDDFKAAFKTLITAMNTDLVWIRDHTFLQDRALDWSNKGEDPSALLRGAELAKFEAWQAQLQGPDQEVKPTVLQKQYIIASRAAETRSQKLKTRIARIVSAVFIVLALVAVYMAIQAVRQRNTARHQTRIANAGRLAATALNLKDTQLDLASLLSLEASHTEDTFDTRNARLTLFQSAPGLLTYLHPASSINDVFDSVTSIAFQRDGSRFATGSARGAIELWDAKTRQPLWTHLNPRRHVQQLAISPDGNTLAIIFLYSDLELWNISGKTPVLLAQAPPASPGQPMSLAFHPSGKLLAVGGNAVQVFELPQMLALRKLAPTAGPVWSVAFSPTDHLLFAYSTHDAIHFDNAVTAVPRGEIKLPPATTTGFGFGEFAFSPDGTQLAADDSSGLALFQLGVNGDHIAASLRGHLPIGDDGALMGIAFSPDGTRLVAASSHGAMREWDTASLKPQRDYPSSLAITHYSVAFSPDGALLYSGLKSGTILVWDELYSDAQKIPTPGYTVAGFTPDSENVLLTNADNSTARWNIATRKLIADAPPATNSSFNPSSYVVTGRPGVSARVTSAGLELDEGTHILATLPDPPKFELTITISADNKFIAAANSSGTPDSRRLWDLRSGTPKVIPLQGTDDGTFGLAFNPAGTLLATTGHGGLFLWNTADGSLFGANIDQHRKPLRNAVFSPDGDRIALYASGGEVLIADVATQNLLGLPLQSDFNQTTGGTGIAFSPDGKLLAYDSDNGSIVLWPADPKSWAARPCRLANRNLSLAEWKRYMGDTIPYHPTCPAK